MLFNFFGRRRLGDAAHGLYTSAIEQARRGEFYAACGVPDTLDGRFDLLVLHVFLLVHRLGMGGDKDLSQALFDLMFADMDQNLREMGASDISVGSKVKTMAQAFYGRAGAYEAGLADAARLAEALERNLYRGSAPPSPVLAAMASYVQAQAASLAGQDMAALQQGRVRFGAPVMPPETSQVMP